MTIKDINFCILMRSCGGRITYCQFIQQEHFYITLQDVQVVIVSSATLNFEKHKHPI